VFAAIAVYEKKGNVISFRIKRQRQGQSCPKIKLALVCTAGGHLEQMLNLSQLYDQYSHFWITMANPLTESCLREEKRYFIKLAHFKKPWTYFCQFPKGIWIFAKERPTHVISTGSGRIVFIPFLLSLIFRAKFIHIETFSHVNNLTMFGRFLSRIGYPILTQWQSLARTNAVYIGPVIRNESALESRGEKTDLVFVTLGTRTEPFPRIIRAVETLIMEGILTRPVVVQSGHTKYESKSMEIFDFCAPPVIDDLIRNAAFVITQESAGIGTKCLKHDTRMIIMPRQYVYGELPAKSDMNEDLHIRLQELGFAFVVNDTEELRAAILNIDKLRVGFPFENSLAISELRKLVEKA
jgi:UDP-N-acetylglucosamine transferase subunit ALG13